MSFERALVAAALDDGRRSGCSPLFAGGSLAARTAYRAAQELRLLVMRNRSRPLAADGRRGTIHTDIGLRRTIGTLHALDPLRPISARLVPLVALITIPTIAIPITPVLTVGITTIAAITPIAVAIAIVELASATFARTPVVVARTVVVALLSFSAGGLLLLSVGLTLRLGSILAVLVAEIVVHRDGLAEPGRTRTPHPVLHIAAALSDLLLAEGHDDAVVMLGVLQVVLSQNRVTGRLRVACERDVLLSDMSRRAAQFDVRPRTFEATRQRVLTFAVLVIIVVVIIVAAAAASAVLLSLPHGLHSRQL
jgi:hypothetical protein